MQAFATIDNSLVGTPGMEFRRNTYSATDAIEELEMGKGNSGQIETKIADEAYRVKLVQTRFKYFDEELMTDPLAIQKGIDHIPEEMFNKVNADVYGELAKATIEVPGTTPGFDTFVNAVAALNMENQEGTGIFALVHPNDIAKVRKAAKDSLQYVESFIRTGYIGTMAGVSLYVTKQAVENQIVGGTREAVTVFNKKGVEVEQSVKHQRSADDANIRVNWIYATKLYVAQLTDATKAFKITLGEGA